MDTVVGGIDGLVWEDLWRVDNGGDSAVVPLPTLSPVNVIFKGDEPFTYGHYGVHLGQADRLIFLGPASRRVRGYFIDCRASSSTFGRRAEIEFAPSSSRRLTIPPGVAHTFDSHGVFTLNPYLLYLPDPDRWLSGESGWSVAGDILNIPMDVSDTELPRVEPNEHAASDIFYRYIARLQRESLTGLQHVYPYTEDVDLDDGRHRLLIREPLGERREVPDWAPVGAIDGVGWAAHPVVWTGDQSGYVPLLFERPMHIIDHGEQRFAHDAFGVHLGGDDHLTFLGPADQQVRVRLVDFRRGSSTLHHDVTVEFRPDPRSYLVIPRGVAHAFDGLENVFTVNAPKAHAPRSGQYAPGTDVIDWDLDRDFPELDTYDEEPAAAYYEELVAAQQQMIATPAMHSTPVVLMLPDAAGRDVRVALRKRLAG